MFCATLWQLSPAPCFFGNLCRGDVRGPCAGGMCGGPCAEACAKLCFGNEQIRNEDKLETSAVYMSVRFVTQSSVLQCSVI